MEKIGTENFKLDNHPFYVPKENLKFLQDMEKIKEKREICTFANQSYPSKSQPEKIKKLK